MSDLQPTLWTPRLTTCALGRAVNRYAHTLTSTNQVLKEMARHGAPHGSLCLCECQTAGRGRMDRQWCSPAGQGLWLSVLLRPAMQAERAPLLTFCAALAMAESVRRVSRLDVRIKWPNDLVLDGRKLCGILSEMGFDAQGMFIVVGTGLNIRRGAYPDTLRDRAISVEERAPAPDRGEVLASYLYTLEEAVSAVEKSGWDGIAEQYRALSVTLGSEVQVIGTESFNGTAEDIDGEGALLVRTEDGALRRVLAGDVSVRGVMGYV